MSHVPKHERKYGMCWQAGTYSEAMDFLFGRINYEHVQTDSFSAADLKLQRMQELLLHLGSPQQHIPTATSPARRVKDRRPRCWLPSSIPPA